MSVILDRLSQDLGQQSSHRKRQPRLAPCCDHVPQILRPWALPDGCADPVVVRREPVIESPVASDPGVSGSCCDSPQHVFFTHVELSCDCLLYTSPSPRDGLLSRMPSS